MLAALFTVISLWRSSVGGCSATAFVPSATSAQHDKAAVRCCSTCLRTRRIPCCTNQVSAARRSILWNSMIFISWSWLSSPADGVAGENLEPSECRDGAIAIENSIPGAYEQSCMTLSERRIPLKSTGDILTVLQGNVGAGRTGVVVWNSSLLLTRFLDAVSQNQVSWLKDKCVLELGCGAALASLAVARLGAARVLATDGNSEVMELARQNVEHNHLRDRVKVSMLQWGFLGASDHVEEADVVIGSDLTYNSGTWRVLAETVETVLKPGGIFVYLTLGHPGFNVEGELNGFLSVLRQVEGIRVVTDESACPIRAASKTLEECISVQEKDVLSATGGARVVIAEKHI